MSQWRRNPSDYAIELVENRIVTKDHLIMCALKAMSDDDIRLMLDNNELSPRFQEDQD